MYSHMIAVTDRKLCPRPLTEQLERLAATDVEAIVLREKDLDEAAYRKLAEEALEILAPYGKRLVLHTCLETARALSCRSIHLPLPVLEKAGPGLAADFDWIGASVHSMDEARRALACGANHLTAGHIFETDCKKGLPGRGLDFLREICAASPVPVYAIGGVTKDNLPVVMAAGAAGGCMMSAAMRI